MNIKKEPSYWTEQKVLLTQRILNIINQSIGNGANTFLSCSE